MKGSPTAGIPFSLFNGVLSYSLRLDILESVNIRKGEEVFDSFRYRSFSNCHGSCVERSWIRFPVISGSEKPLYSTFSATLWESGC